MNREIKFRAWEPQKKEMLMVDILHWFWSLNPRTLQLKSDGISSVTGIMNHGYTVQGGITAGKSVIMQYTGLKDKNGKEIYEGDIVQKNNKKQEVYWDDNMAAFMPFNDDRELFFAGDSEIIGNIYKNPGLI